jgi:hypothetical protein
MRVSLIYKITGKTVKRYVQYGCSVSEAIMPKATKEPKAAKEPKAVKEPKAAKEPKMKAEKPPKAAGEKRGTAIRWCKL